jgi:hypothetical protein
MEGLVRGFDMSLLDWKVSEKSGFFLAGRLRLAFQCLFPICLSLCGEITENKAIL